MNSTPTPTSTPLVPLRASELIDIIKVTNTSRYTDFYEIAPNGQYNIKIKDVEILDHVTLDGNIITSDFLSIWNCLFREGITFFGIKLKQHISISNSTFEGQFSIPDGVFNGTFSTSYCKFNDGFVIAGGTFDGKFFISHSVFKKHAEITGGTFIENFYISDSSFANLLISGGAYNKVFSLQNIRVADSFQIEGGIFKDYISVADSFINILGIRNLKEKTLISIPNSVIINSLHIKHTIFKDSFIRIYTEVNELAFIDVLNFGTILFTGCTFKNYLHTFNSSTEEIVDDKISKPSLKIINSDIGKTTFINCDLSSFDLDFNSSKITEVFVTGTRMPRKITTELALNHLNYHQHQLGYSQIKKIYEARGDKVEANRYYAKEMQAYQQTLSWSNWDDFWEKLNLGLSKISTNYGQSWQRGLGMTLFVGAVFYTFYCWSLGFWPALLDEKSFERFSSLCTYYLEFLNPIHKADYVAEQLLSDDLLIEKVKVPGWARFWEGISRIFIAYFGYQLVQAFRKHGKSSG
ncbi:hypothetical protein IC229_05990 [Spirosoma sp. BT702]|uniref:Pentapeptide repeat-containing protein n=1 Tax=Spirosoma profusum TaxID=2771354 RepID=A0A926XU34_9BACT|nr:hypothetical protein [Spirosoma profusum]MBD2700177.1 hypothetical protein [Spirosoma profusum]